MSFDFIQIKPFKYAVFMTIIAGSYSCKESNTLQSDITSQRAEIGLVNDKHDNTSNMVYIKSGELETMDYLNGKKKNVKLSSFYIDKNLVTVAEYEAFVKKTGYVTEAERFGNSPIFEFQTGEWSMKDGAYYLFPFGKDHAKAQPNHPVTQVSWNDAIAYAKWQGKRLPTAAEWEWAASSGGQSKSTYAWGNQMKEGNTFKANYWQGEFPNNNTIEDGFPTTSPVGFFGSNKIGLNDMGGNVWQWTSDPTPPTAAEAQTDTSMRIVTKGGSFLCDPDVCHGFKIDGKSSSTSETGMVHTGFRCVKDSR